MHEFLTGLLQCPVCRGELIWSVHSSHGHRFEEGEARCRDCSRSYPIREGIGIFLSPELDREDLWEEVESGLMETIRDNPEIERQLMDVPLESLAPADQFFRSMVLDERGDYVNAAAAEKIAHEGLYTPEYLKCWHSQVTYLLAQLNEPSYPIVDLASGRCYLVEKLVKMFSVPIIATDFSPRILRRDRRWLEAVGLYDQVSLLAFDARQTPFKDGAVQTMTTNLGLPNIKEPGTLFEELRRVVSGNFYAITNFYTGDDDNAGIIEQFGLGDTLYKENLIKGMTSAGFQVTLANTNSGLAKPTPSGVVIDGAQIDGMPIVETELDWSVVEAT